MSDDTNNIVAFEPRRQESPALRFVELRLDDDCGLELAVVDGENNVVATLAYDLVYVTPGFDLDMLRAAWDVWRGNSAAAS